MEVDDDMDELHRLDKGRITVKTPRQPLIQHKVSAWINGVEYTVHMVEEKCYNQDKCKCWGRRFIGSSEEISSDDSDSEIGTQTMNEDVMSETKLSEEDSLPSAAGGGQGQGVTVAQRTDGQYQSNKPQINNQRLLTRAHEWVILDTCSDQREADRSNLRPDKSEKIQAQETVDESNRTPSSRKGNEVKINEDKTEKGLIKETEMVAAVIAEREHALEWENCKEGSGSEVDLVTPTNFELVATDPCVGLQNVEGGGPSMGLSKDTLHDKTGVAKNNVNCDQKGPRHMEKVYSRSRGCRKKLGHGHIVGLFKKINNNTHNEVNSVIENHDNLSPEMRGSGLKEVAEWKALNKEQPPTQAPLQKNSHETCVKVREATSQWNMVQNLGVTCATRDATVSQS